MDPARLVRRFSVPWLMIAATMGCAKQTPPPPEPPPIDVVVATPITKQIVEWDEYTGRLEPIESVEVRARVGGYLQDIYFDEGDIVRKGDLLCIIDQRPFAAVVRRAEADLAEARSRELQAAAELARAEAQQKEAQARVVLEKQRFHRVEQLVGANAISREEYDIRQSTLNQVSAAAESAAANVATAKASVEVAKAAVEAAEAALESARINLDYTEVRAPISGRVSDRFVTEGNLISGGTADSTLLTTIVSLDPIHVYFDADEASFLKYQRMAADEARASSRSYKNPVYLALADESPAFPHEGHFDFIDNRLDPNTGTMRGRAILRNPDFLLTPGLFARVRLPGSEPHEAVLIPDAAIISDQSERIVYVVADDGAIRRQPIVTGATAHGLRIVTQGLSGDERIIVRGLQRVRPGVKAQPSLETLALSEAEGLPDHYEPVPQDRWISREVSYLPGLDGERVAKRSIRADDLPVTAAAGE